MVRRATILKKYSSNGLIIGGFYEFSKYNNILEPDSLKLARILKKLPYNFIAVRKSVAEALKEKGIFLDSRFVVVDEKEVVKEINFKGKRIFLFFFPELSTSDINKRFTVFAKKLDNIPSEAISIAITPWGFDLENRFLTDFDVKLNILFGSGKGFSYHIKSGGKVWIHPCKKGVCVYKVYEKRGDFFVKKIILNEGIEEDNQIKDLLR